MWKELKLWITYKRVKQAPESGVQTLNRLYGPSIYYISKGMGGRGPMGSEKWQFLVMFSTVFKYVLLLSCWMGQKSTKCADIIYGWPLSLRVNLFTSHNLVTCWRQRFHFWLLDKINYLTRNFYFDPHGQSW